MVVFFPLPLSGKAGVSSCRAVSVCPTQKGFPSYCSDTALFDSNGNLIASETFKKKLGAVCVNYDKAEKTLTIIDDQGRAQRRPLYTILLFIKAFDVTDLKDKIYGVLGVVNASVHQYIQADKETSLAKLIGTR
jgi:hypothetical protein